MWRPCACLYSCQGASTAQRGGIVDPEPGRRPPGRRFVLHRTSGPRLRYAARSNPAFGPLERGLLLLLRASTPPPRSLPQPPPPPQPWPPSGIHFHRSDPPFGRSCIVSALSVYPVCRPREAASAAAAAARAAGRAAGAAGSMAAAWAAAEVAVWPPGWAMAAARAPVRASQAAFSRSSRAAAAAPLEAAAAAESRRWRPGRRLRGVRSQGAGGGGRRRRGAASGGLPDVASMHACAMPVYQRKKLGPSDAVLSRCARVCAICLCISDASNSAVHVGMSHVCVALLTKNHLTGCPPLF